MTLKRFDYVARLRVPDPDRVIVRARDDAQSIGRERHRAHPVSVSMEIAEERTGGEIPDLAGVCRFDSLRGTDNK